MNVDIFVKYTGSVFVLFPWAAVMIHIHDHSGVWCWSKFCAVAYSTISYSMINSRHQNVAADALLRIEIEIDIVHWNISGSACAEFS